MAGTAFLTTGVKTGLTASDGLMAWNVVTGFGRMVGNEGDVEMMVPTGLRAGGCTDTIGFTSTLMSFGSVVPPQPCQERKSLLHMTRKPM